MIYNVLVVGEIMYFFIILFFVRDDVFCFWVVVEIFIKDVIVIYYKLDDDVVKDSEF